VLSHLLDLGMDINEMSDMGLPAGRSRGLFTPLHAAAGADFVDAIVLLLKRGANPDIRSTFGETPLDLAVRRGNEAAIRALKKNAP
jgi:ankyrin repeat protein